MTPTTHLSAIAAALLAAASAEARNGRWNQVRDAPAEATMVQAEMDMMAQGWSPKPTPAPKPRRELFGLEDRAITENAPDTCGYVEGVETMSLYCDPASVCVADGLNSQVGCCPSSNTLCDIWTTCLNSDEGDQYTTDNGLTMWCGFEDYPNCVTHVYQDDVFTGYTLFGCGRIEGSDDVWYLPTAAADVSSADSDSSGTYTSGSLFPTETDSDVDSESDSTDDEDIGSDDGSSGGSNKKKSSTGGIVGGVVGGVAAAALAGFAVFWFIKKRKAKKDAENAGATGAGAFVAGGGEKPGDNHTPPPMAAHNVAPQGAYPQPAMQGQPGMMTNNGGGAVPMGYPPSAPGSPPPQGAHYPSMYSNPSDYPQQHAGMGYPSGVPGQYGQAPVSPQPSGGYPTPAPAYNQPIQQQNAGTYNRGEWGQPPAGTPPPVGQQPPPQQGFVAELPTEKSHGEVRELAG
ncbi:uncharacterized protein MKZ38_004654 [Zalerion maritima]|uniref:Uncharacterized protein n=1 Tax=Zalerion maritima TaxID=339359 RepID=A0AAD5WQU1_9PEZI|nr:uncharacterized protein MKZ38_004654 [Zalerion maritima]